MSRVNGFFDQHFPNTLRLLFLFLDVSLGTQFPMNYSQTGKKLLHCLKLEQIWPKNLTDATKHFLLGRVRNKSISFLIT